MEPVKRNTVEPERKNKNYSCQTCFAYLIFTVFPMSKTDNINEIKRSRNPRDFDMFDTEYLSRYVTDTGKILPRRVTGLTSAHQRSVTKAIKRARNMLLMK